MTRRLAVATVLALLHWNLPAQCLAGDDPPASQSAATLSPLVSQSVINAPVAEAWRVFSTPTGFKKLGVQQCDMDFRIGGLIRTKYDADGVLGDDKTIHNEILAFEPERMLSIRIFRPPIGFPFAEETWKRTWSVITLTPMNESQTSVRIAGMGYPDTEDGRKMRAFFESGNGWVLKKLQQQFDATASGPTCGAHVEDPLAAIEVEATVELPRADSWRLLTTAGGWNQLLGATARIEATPGGAFEVFMKPLSPLDDQGSAGCSVLSLVPEQMISFTWNPPPKFAYARRERTWVVVQLEEFGPKRTHLRISHFGFADEAAENPGMRDDVVQVRAFFQRHWRSVLDALKRQAPAAANADER